MSKLRLTSCSLSTSSPSCHESVLDVIVMWSGPASAPATPPPSCPQAMRLILVPSQVPLMWYVRSPLASWRPDVYCGHSDSRNATSPLRQSLRQITTSKSTTNYYVKVYDKLLRQSLRQITTSKSTTNYYVLRTFAFSVSVILRKIHHRLPRCGSLHLQLLLPFALCSCC